MSAPNDKTENAVKILTDFRVRWKLVELFYTLDFDFEQDDKGEDITFAIVHRHNKFDNPIYLPSDVKLPIECRETGLNFAVCHHTVADVIEFSAVDDAWTWVLNVRVEEYSETSIYEDKFEDDDASIAMSNSIKVSGDAKKFCDYPMQLKLTLPAGHEHEGFNVVGNPHETGIAPINWNELFEFNKKKMSK